MSYFTIFRLISIATLIFALFDLPYGYYTILRIIITGLACIGIYKSVLMNYKLFTIGFTISAIIFNPLIPISFEQETWQFIDVVTALYLFTTIFFIGNDVKIVRAKLKSAISRLNSIVIWLVKVIILPCSAVALLIYLVVMTLGHFNAENDSTSKLPEIDSTYIKSKADSALLNSQKIDNKLKSKVIYYDIFKRLNFDSVHVTSDTILMICRDSIADKIIIRLTKNDSTNNQFDIIAEDTIVQYSISFWTVNFDKNFNNFPVIKAYQLKTCQGELCYQTHFYWYNKSTLVRIFLLYGDIVDSEDDADISFNKSCISEWPVICVNIHASVRTDYFTFDDSLGYYNKVSEIPCLVE